MDLVNFQAQRPQAGANVGGGRGPPRRVRKVLSLDGGGVRGLSTVIILRYLMEQLPPLANGEYHEPWQVFDMIGGTSTGGLQAIMLGRLRMRISDCEDSFTEFSKAIFTPKRSTVDPRRLLDLVNADGKFDEQPLEKLVKDKIRAAKLDEGCLLKDLREDACKVFVSSVRQEDSSAVVLRSYRCPRLPNWYLERCKIWEAARATSAASTFFDPIQIGHTKFVDGGVRNNNPINLVDNEARNLWPNDDIFILSIGTGDAPGGSFEGSLKTVVDRLKEIATDTEQTNDMFFTQHQTMMRQHLLFRFNVPGLGEVGLDESQHKPRIIARTQSYVERPDTLEKAMNCLGILCRGLVESEDDVEDIQDEFASLTMTDIVESINYLCSTCGKGIRHREPAFCCTECLKPPIFCYDCSVKHHFHSEMLINFIFLPANQATAAGIPRNRKCTRCLRVATSCTMCVTCKLCLCHDCDADSKTLKSWIASHGTQVEPHRSMIFIQLEEWQGIEPAKGPCKCRNMYNVIGHCGVCFQPLTVGDVRYTCIDCVRIGGSRELCEECYIGYARGHPSDHSFEMVIFQDLDHEDKAGLDKSLQCIECDEKMNVIIHTYPAVHRFHPHTAYVLQVSPLVADSVRPWAWERCPKLWHTRPEFREIQATPWLCQCGEPVTLKNPFSICFQPGCNGWVTCANCRRIEQDFHRHELTTVKAQGIDGEAKYDCFVCEKEAAGYLWSSCPQCNQQICNTCLYNHNNPSPKCCDADRGPDEPRWILGCKAETKTTYLYPQLECSLPQPPPTPPRKPRLLQNEASSPPSSYSSRSSTPSPPQASSSTPQQPMGFRKRLLLKTLETLLDP